MSIFTKLTQRYLSKNKTRTIVTLIGIIVSMALFTAVIEGAYSGYQFLKNREIVVTGEWQVIMNNVNIAKHASMIISGGATKCEPTAQT